MLKSRTLRFALAAALVSLAPKVARADAVAPPPTNCLDGTTGQTCHGGQFCQPTTCTSASDCTAGQVCQPRSFCLRQISCGGLLPPDASPTLEPAAGSTCSTAADCDGGATCATESLCITPGSTSSSGGTTGTESSGSSGGNTVIHSGCSCEAAGGRGPVFLSLGMVLAGAASLLSRRRAPLRRRP